MEDSLIVTYDSNYPDVPTIVIARKDKYNINIVSEFQGDMAFGIYCLLMDKAYLINQKDVPKKPIGDLNSVPHYRCPNCNNAIVVYEFDYKYPNCKWCGQAIDWK